MQMQNYNNFSKDQGADEILFIKNYPFTSADLNLQRDKSNKGFVCPYCGAGGGRHGTGLFFIPKGKTLKGGRPAMYDYFYCFSCNDTRTGRVGKAYTRIDLYMQARGYMQKDFHKAIEELKALAGGCVNLYKETYRNVPTKPFVDTTEADERKARAYLSECLPFDALPSAYRRNIPMDIAERFGICFHDRQKDKVHKGKYLDDARIVIRYSDTAYNARRVEWTGADVDKKVIRYDGGVPTKYRRNKGKFRFFNEDVISKGKGKYLFVTEGTFDAISGYCARLKDIDFISLEGANQTRRFIDLLVTHRFSESGRVLVYFADNDDKGGLAKTALKDLCEHNGIEVHFFGIPATVNDVECKDFSDFYNIDADAFRAYLEGVVSSIVSVTTSQNNKKENTALFNVEEVEKVKGGFSHYDYELDFTTEYRPCPF